MRCDVQQSCRHYRAATCVTPVWRIVSVTSMFLAQLSLRPTWPTIRGLHAPTLHRVASIYLEYLYAIKINFHGAIVCQQNRAFFVQGQTEKWQFAG